MIAGGMDEIAEEYVTVLRALGAATPHQVASRLGVSECCAVYWLAELARQGWLRMAVVEAVAPDETPCAPESLRGCPRKPTCPAVIMQGTDAAGRATGSPGTADRCREGAGRTPLVLGPWPAPVVRGGGT